MSSDTEIFHQSRVPEVYGGTITLTVLATLAVAARLVARRLSVAKYWWDDLLIVFALVRRTVRQYRRESPLLIILRFWSGASVPLLGSQLSLAAMAAILSLAVGLLDRNSK